MSEKPGVPVLERARAEICKLMEKHRLKRTNVSITASVLTPEEAIGRPICEAEDYPIIKGKERVIEARLLDAKGQAFTDSPADFTGTVEEVISLPFTGNRNRAIFTAVLNALCRHLGIAEGTVHCKDDDPEKCGMEIVSHVLKLRGRCRVGLVGFNPAIARKLVEAFGCGNVRIVDLNNENIGSVKCGVRIEDGAAESESLIRWADVVLITGTTLVNGTFDGLWNCAQEHGKNCLIYGITGAGVSSLTGIGRICPFGRNS